MISKKKVEDVLSWNWIVFNKELPKYKELDLAKLIEAEVLGRKRRSYIKRMHTRLCALRQRREYDEILKEIK